MRTETINVYSFDELSESAKRQAISEVRAMCMYEHVCRDWDEARPVLTEFLKYIGVTIDIRISPESVDSKGSYYKCFVPMEDDEERWLDCSKHLGESYGKKNWFLDKLYEVMMNYSYDKYRSFDSNICSVVVIFCGIIDFGDKDYCDDNAVIDYINECCIDFLENGTTYDDV